MTEHKSDTDRVRVSVYLSRRQRKRLNQMADELDVSTSDYILEPALERLERDEAAQRERQHVAEDKSDE